jgi:lysine 2,3-aminomutase
VYSAPAVKPGQFFPYFDPVDQLEPDMQKAWKDPAEQSRMIAAAIDEAKNNPK